LERLIILGMKLKKNNSEFNEKDLDYHSNIKMGSIIEEEYNEAFNHGEIEIENFSTEKAFYTKISPFKKAISEKLKDYELKDGIEEELNCFKKMLLKTQIILTTNYDTFVEDFYNAESSNKVQKYTGQKGFFEQTLGFAELYKIHGCVDSPNDIIISESDYNKFEKNSILISAKIISMLMHSPVIFMGYSLTDNNIRKIIKDFAYSLKDEEVGNLEKRLILIEWQENQSDFIEEIANDKDLGCKIRVIKTDNFQKIFEIIGDIQQGIAPSEIRRYQNFISELIIDRGKKGTLNSVLVSPGDLNNIEDKHLVVALGDARYIFQIPDFITYCLDYITEKNEINNEIIMRFAAQQKGRFPINKLDKNLIDTSSLHSTEKENLKQKIKKYSNFDQPYKKINPSSVYNENTKDIDEIIEKEDKKSKIYETISYNIKNLDLKDVKKFLIKELEELKKNGEIRCSTELRRLLLLYDICVNTKRDNA
jgi:hypothetical protein